MEIDSRDLVTLQNVRVEALYPDERLTPYFTVIHEGEIISVRNSLPGNFALLEEHRDKPLDLTIFPYKWEACGLSGVVNYFQYFRIHKED